MKLLDLFSGIGGFSLAAKWAGIETIQFVEKDDFCQKILMKNFPGVPIHDDIKTFNFYSDVDILTGGFPCQPFSIAGKKKGALDERYLWPEMFRIIKQCKPKFIIAENVPGIIPDLDPVLEDLEGEGYQWATYLIPASFIGAPHKRERLWIVANSNSLSSQQADKASFPQPIKRDSRMGYTRQNREITTQSYWEKNKPPIPGVDDGIPDVMDRNKSLGNSIIPQIAYIFLKAIAMVG